VQSAWAVSHKSNCFLTAQFYRRAAHQGEKKAIVATAHQLLVIAFYILRDGTVYHEKGGNYFDQINPERTKRKLMARLERMGFDVILQKSTDPFPSTPAPPVQPGDVAAPVNASNVELTANTGSNKSSFSKDWPDKGVIRPSEFLRYLYQALGE
jgi:hypothetical protein